MQPYKNLFDRAQPFILFVVLVLLFFSHASLHAQTPLDDQLSRALNALKNMNFDVEKNSAGVVKGFFQRTFNGGIESTDVSVNGTLTAEDARKNFDNTAQSYRTPPNNNPPVEFWRNETFSVVGANDAVLQAWLAPNPDSTNGSAFGFLVCGNLMADFKMTLNGSARDKALVDSTQAELKALMTQVGQAIQGAGACTPGAEPQATPLSPGVEPTLATITDAEGVSIDVKRSSKFVPNPNDWERKIGKGRELHFGDAFCFRGRGTVKLKWWDGSIVSLSDPNVGSERGKYARCFEIKLKNPGSTSGPNAIVDFAASYLENLAGFGKMVRFAVTPPPEEKVSKFGASAHTVVLAIKGTTFVFGEGATPNSSLVCVEEGVVAATPLNTSLAPFDVTAGNQAQVTESAVSPITAGCTLPTNPAIAQPNTNVTRMTLQAAERYVTASETVLVPFWIVNANNLANLNFEIAYDPAVIQLAGDPVKGNLLDNALFSANAKNSGKVLVGLAQTQALQGTGTVLSVPFRVVGKPGDISSLVLDVTAINDPNGGKLEIDRIPGQVVIVNDDGTLPPNIGDGTTPGGIALGDCDGSGALNELDALCALEMSVGLRAERVYVDMDSSGLPITSRDAVIILQRAVGQ